ncbi:MAG: cyclic nucleotide-binding domain-containing protein [Shimia sp.]
MERQIDDMIAIMSAAFSLAFDYAPECALAAGAMLFRRGDTVRYLFMLREGRVALRRALADGGGLTLHVAGPSEVVAPASLWAEATHCDAICDTDCRRRVVGSASPTGSASRRLRSTVSWDGAGGISDRPTRVQETSQRGPAQPAGLVGG